MMTPDEIQGLVQRLQASDATLFECEGPEGLLRLRFSRPPSGAVPGGVMTAGSGQAPEAQPLAAAALVRSPGIGRFCRRHPLDEVESSREGDRVEQGQILAFLRVGELLTPVFTDQAGVVHRVLAGEGDLIGYGEPLVELVRE